MTSNSSFNSSELYKIHAVILTKPNNPYFLRGQQKQLREELKTVFVILSMFPKQKQIT